jgi:ketosteroid isomerase-like protein
MVIHYHLTQPPSIAGKAGNLFSLVHCAHLITWGSVLLSFTINFTNMNFFRILIVAALFASCSKTTDTVNIQDLNRQFIDAWNNKDAAKITNLLADDAEFLQGNTHYKGKSEVAEKWVRETLPTLSDLKTNVVSSGTDTQMGYEAGTFSVDVLPVNPADPHAYGEGNYTFLWKKVADNSWKLSYAQLEDLPVQVKN